MNSKTREKAKKIDTRLRELRKEKNLALRDLAEKLDVDKSTLSNYEKGKTVPNANFLKKAAKYFGVTVDYILKLSNLKESPNPDIKATIEKDPELFAYWKKNRKRPKVKELMKRINDLSAGSIDKIVQLINELEKDFQ